MIRQDLRQYPEKLIGLTNGLLKSANEHLKGAERPRGLLLLFDNLDRFEPDMIRLLLFDGRSLSQPIACHAIFTMPISLHYGPDSPYQDSYGGPAMILPMLALREPLAVWKDTVAESSYDEKGVEELIADAAATRTVRGAIVLLGLEETPGIVPAVGEERRRPPALAILNPTREAIRSHCPHPLIVWCDSLTYGALREHAPDFFDPFTGLFSFERPEAAGRKERGIPFQMIPARRVSAELPPILVRGSPAALAFYEERAAEYREPTLERVRALLGLAETLWAHPDSNVSARWSRAEQTAIEALGILSKDRAPADWARGQLILGRIYRDHVQGDRRENLERAIACHEAALQVYSEAEFPIDWAKTQSSLALACANLPTSDRVGNLRRALACYEAALRVLTEAEWPRDWALVQINLGTAYACLPTGDRAEHLRYAVGCFEAALRVCTRVDHPQQWEMAQHNLEEARQELARLQTAPA